MSLRCVWFTLAFPVLFATKSALIFAAFEDVLLEEGFVDFSSK